MPTTYKNSSDSLNRINWSDTEHFKSNVAASPKDFPKSLKAAYEKSTFKDDTGKWKLNVLRAHQVNKENAIAKWKTDIFFKTKA
jgi:hypothetical protein